MTTPEVVVLYAGTYAVILPHLDDSRDRRKCPVCGWMFGDATIARRMTDDALIHAFDCRGSKRSV
jgi:hypothetical protein